ncbi:glycosyltransferase family 4 protein [Aureispira sp. CCB-E]|uniref:glycosyltransferase family 4 protein n=1 Tax=Aureispira sp. CCB-E TaxID=3051121 RepID=UPI002868EC13|nr:glycosyltransferase family 4 protein [Aureispira sp. CCB-E]WMX15218.1 glycosyltransferase family 4 protein [Aureispira sp. CCB-E]
MHIIFYISRFGIGGIQTFVIQLAKELIQLPNVKVSIFCHHPEQVDTSSNEPIPAEIEILTLSKNAKTIVLINKLRNWIKKIIPSFDLKEWLTTRYFLKLLKNKQVDVIHNNIQLGDENVYLAQQRLNIPYITTLHGAYKHILRQEVSETEKKILKNTLEKLLSTASAIVYLSPANILPFKEIFPNRSFVDESLFLKIYNGLAEQQVVTGSDSLNNKITFGMVARGHQDKGWIELLEVTDELLKAGYEQIELRLFADGDYVDKLMQQKDWHPNIKYMGATHSPIAEILNFDVGLLPSYHEEMPFTIIEYLACGKPSIATNVGAIEEMLCTDSKEVAGILIPLNTEKKVSKAHLKAAMLAFVKDSNLVLKYGKQAQKAFEKFNIKNTTKQYYNVYQKALKK